MSSEYCVVLKTSEEKKVFIIHGTCWLAGLFIRQSSVSVAAKEVGGFRILPRSWSLCGRCSGLSGGTFLASSFFSTGQNLKFLLFFPLTLVKNKKTKLNRSGEVLQYLGLVWLKVHWGEEVSLVSGNTKPNEMENIFWFSFFFNNFHLFLHF